MAKKFAKTKTGRKSRARAPIPEGGSNAAPLRPTLDDVVGLGCPTSYRKAYAKDAEYLCSLGATDSDLATFFGVRPETISDWRAKHEDFGLALKVGKSAADERVERSLYMNAVGYEYDAVETFVVDKDIVDHPVRKRVLPNTSAQIFWLKNRRKDLWRDVHQLEHGRPGEFEAMSDLDLAKRMAESARSLALLEGELSKKSKG